MKVLIKKVACIVAIVSVVSSSFLTRFIVSPAYAAGGLLSSASIQLGDSRPSQSGVTYTTTFTFPNTDQIECIQINFNSNPDMGGSAPNMNVAGAVKGTITGGGLTDANWTLYSDNTTKTIQLESGSLRSTTSTQVVIPVTTITNTSSSLFYAQIKTYSAVNGSHVCSGDIDQSNVIALTTVAGVTATVTVSPTIAFAVTNYGSAVNGSGDTSPVTTTSTTIPFGTVAAGANAWGSQTLTVSTNGAHGYTLYVRDSQSMTNPNSDTIRNQSGTPSAPEDFDASASQSSFAYTADGAGVTFGSNKWAGLTQTNTAIATRTVAYNSDATHVEYKVGISNVQPPGAYSTIVAYTATPSY